MTIDLAPLVAPLLVALIAWLGPRLTRERRLLTELRRFGEVRANLPPSSERDRLDEQIVVTVRSLNEWIDPHNRRSRRRQNAIFWIIPILAGIAVFAIQFLDFDPDESSTLTNWVVFVAGFLGGISMVLIDYLATRRDQRQLERDHNLASQARTASILQVSNPRTESKDGHAR